MEKQETDALAEFCVDQHFAFDTQAWLRRNKYDHNASAIAAMYLSLTSWYGHEKELERICANALTIHASGAEFQRAAQSASFDAATFASQVRRGITALRTRMPTAEPGSVPRAGSASASQQRA